MGEVQLVGGIHSVDGVYSMGGVHSVGGVYSMKYPQWSTLTSAKPKLWSGCPGKLRGALGSLSVSIGPVMPRAPIPSL